MPLIACPDCQARVSDRAASCIHCGCPLGQVPPARPSTAPIAASNPGLEVRHPLPAMLSAVVPGVGQLLKGHKRRAWVIYRNFAIYLVATSLVAVLTLPLWPLSAPLGVLAAALWLSMYLRNVGDAYNSNEDLAAVPGVLPVRLITPDMEQRIRERVVDVFLGKPVFQPASARKRKTDRS